jgi:hypothetical protein
MQILSPMSTVFCVLSVFAHAEVHFDDFRTDLSELLPTGPSHLDSYGIGSGELSIDGRGYVPHRSNENWGVPKFKGLSLNLDAAWDTRNTSYDTAYFYPGEFKNRLGYTGYGDIYHSEDRYRREDQDRYRWIDFVVSGGFVLGLLGLGSAGRTLGRLRAAYARNEQEPECDPKPKPQFCHNALRVGPGATREEIKQAYREISKLYHPDKAARRRKEFKKLIMR